jgi:hypothetical protein
LGAWASPKPAAINAVIPIAAIFIGSSRNSLQMNCHQLHTRVLQHLQNCWFGRVAQAPCALHKSLAPLCLYVLTDGAQAANQSRAGSPVLIGPHCATNRRPHGQQYWWGPRYAARGTFRCVSSLSVQAIPNPGTFLHPGEARGNRLYYVPGLHALAMRMHPHECAADDFRQSSSRVSRCGIGFVGADPSTA